jgi:hypothetical protein
VTPDNALASSQETELIRLLMSVAAGLAVTLVLPAAAQTATPTAKPATKPAAKRPAKPAPPKAPAEPPLAAAGDEQKAAASLAYLGEYACDLDQVVTVALSPKHEGYLDLKLKSQAWVMKPVLSSTGALRLEDVKGRLLMIQIANKSMVLDTQIGQRMVDGCLHEKQREFVRTMDSSGNILDTKP